MERIFDEQRRGIKRQVVLPWSRTLAVCWLNIRHRLGRCALSFLCIAVVVAFLASAATHQLIVSALLQSGDVHTQAVLERAGLERHDAEAMQRQHTQRLWLMALSAFLCLVGISNTILMSVTERYREIGTLKCLGARDSFVVRLFLVESVFIGFLASLAGAVAGYGLGVLQAGAALEFSLLGAGTCLHALCIAVPAALVLGTALTTLAAVYPTWVAARMKPVEALRTEV
jgi:uncharacterized membrane protein